MTALEQAVAPPPDRAGSLRFVTQVLEALGFPSAWAEVIEERSFADGRIWREGRPIPSARRVDTPPGV